MPLNYMYYDWNYMILVLPAILFSLIASFMVKRTFKKYQSQLSLRGISGAQAARAVLDRNGLHNVGIRTIGGTLTDNYDPKTNVISLSDDVYSGTSTAAIGVACHEAGHAIQHATGYAPLKLRNAIIPITNIGSQLSIPLVILGIILSRLSMSFIVVAYFGVALFCLLLVFQLVTLPTEFNASSRALRGISDSGILVGDEINGAKKVLRAAAMTYVAALAVSVAQLLRLLLMLGGSRRR